jgi:DNA-binding CsgD family transcriptional regulator
MLQQFGRIVGAQIGICGTVVPAKKGAPMALLPESFIDVGWASERDRRLYLTWMQDTPPDSDLLLRHLIEIVPRERRVETCCRRQVLGDETWYNSALYTDFYRPARLDDELQSFGWVAPSKVIDGVSFIRSSNHGPFGDRQRKLLRLFHAEICRLLGTKLADLFGPTVTELAPRLRQVLIFLLEGDSEKQVAQRLAISRHTVHEHVKRLHRHFGAASRGELLSRTSHFLPVLRKLNEAESMDDPNAAARAFGDAFRLR